MIDSIMDVVNTLNLDVYKKCSFDELNSFQERISSKVREDVNDVVMRIKTRNPFLPHQYQPSYAQFFLPPIEEAYEFAHTTEVEEQTGINKAEAKRSKEHLINFTFTENRLFAIYEDAKNYIYYTYDYDYKDRHQVSLMSRVEYNKE